MNDKGPLKVVVEYRPAMEWQPIETAPVGRWVLVGYNRREMPEYGISDWGVCVARLDSVGGDWYDGSGWTPDPVVWMEQPGKPDWLKLWEANRE